MSRTGSTQDFDHFDDWESFSLDDDIYAGAESDLLDDWEDDGAIAEIREPAGTSIQRLDSQLDSSVDVGVSAESDDTFQLDDESAEVFSLLEKAQSKRANELLELVGPSEDELQKIEGMGIDDYIDVVLSEEAGEETPEDAQVDASAEVLERQSQDELQNDNQINESLDEQDDFEFSEAIESFGDEEVELVVQPLFEGVCVNLPTLFDEDGEVEYKTTARLAKRLTDENVVAVFVATADGEGSTLSRKERKNLVSNVAKAIDTYLISDVSAPSIRQCLEIADDCIEAGSHGLIVTLNVSTKDPYLLCGALHENHRDAAIFVKLEGNAGDLPISPEFLYDLPISGVIDATGDVTFFMNLISAYSGPVYVGNSAMVSTAHIMGASGVVSAAASIHNDLVDQAFQGDAQAQLELSMWERETHSYGSTMSKSIKLALESEFLVSSTMRD